MIFRMVVKIWMDLFFHFVTSHAFDRQTNGRTDRQTDFSSLDRVCIACSAVKMVTKQLIIRWDSERELSLRRHHISTTRYNRLVHKFRHRSTRLYFAPFPRYSLGKVQNCYIWLPLFGLTPPTEGLPWDDLRNIFIERSQMAKVPNS